MLGLGARPERSGTPLGGRARAPYALGAPEAVRAHVHLHPLRSSGSSALFRAFALQAPEPLPPLPEVPLRFVLPGTMHMVEGTGEVTWVDDGGRAGMLFSELTPASRKYLKNWLSKRGPKRRNTVRSASRSDRVRISPPASQ